MNRWAAVAAIFVATLFSVAAYWRVDALDARVLWALCAALLVSAYAAIVIFNTAGRRPKLSREWQTILGVVLFVLLAAIFGASASDYVVACLVGLILGFTANTWARYFPSR